MGAENTLSIIGAELPLNSAIAEMAGRKEGALAARVFVGAKGSSDLPPKGSARHWTGQTAALAGFDAVFHIGRFEKNLRDFVTAIPLFGFDAA